MLRGRHQRNLGAEKKAHLEKHNPSCPQSEKVANELLTDADKPRPQDLATLLEDLLIKLAIVPTIRDGLVDHPQELTVSGDGSILVTAASPRGKPTCDCLTQGIHKCDHERSYTSPTARWCYDHYRDTYFFGDRYYHLVLHQNGHDLPLLTFLPGGNESDEDR